MSRAARTIPHVDQRALAERLPGLIDRHRAECRITVGAIDTGIALPITLQVIDRIGQPWKTVWRVRVYITTTLGGTPGGSQTVTFTTGTVVDPIAAGQYLEVLTDANGVAVFTIEPSVTPTTRYVYAEAVNEFKASGVCTWP